ncbi:rRNA-processing protein cgr1 [Hypoxylon texense]
MSKNQDFELLKPVTTSPQRPRHQVKRSITELKLPRYHHLHHHHNHHHHQRKDRENDALSAGPMLQLPRGPVELPRSEGATPSAAFDINRASMLSSASEDVAYSTATVTPQHPLINQEELLREQREKAVSRIAGLRKSLMELSTFSTETTRRLDDTYYAVLEKLNMLQGTITDLKELAGMSQELDESFKVESQELVTELEQQIDSFGQFDDQQKRILELRGRIHAGRDRVDTLSRRVDVVRERIEGWERADMEWQERTRKRLKIIWIIMSVLIFSLVLLLIAAQYAPSSDEISALTDLALGKEGGQPDLNDIAGNRSESVAALMDEVREAISSRRGDGTVEDNVLRAFDEL